MSYLLIILFAVSLIYFALAERMSKFVTILSMQGFILFGVVFFSLKEIETLDFIFILTETILVKALVVPWFMNRVRKHNQLKRVHEPYVPVFYSIMVVVLSLVISFLLSNSLQNEQIHTKYFTVALASVIFGIYFIIVHRNIFSHVVGYLIIENGIFLFSLAVGSQMPMMVNLAVLLDVVMGVLVLGIFINRIGDTFHSVEIDNLSKLKD
jgi:hydrogenase-4 component E